MDEGQVIAGVEFNRTAATQGAHHVIQTHLTNVAT